MVSNRHRGGGGVNGARGSGSRRLRTAMACNSCRARKTKCNGARPVCDVCEGMGFECLYTLSAQGPAAVRAQMERSMHTEERLSALEDLLRKAIAAKAIDKEETSPPTDRHSAQFQATHWTPPSCHSQDVVDLGSAGDIDHDVVAVTPEIEPGSSDTVDGMGIVTFADETSSGLFGPTSNSALLEHITAALRLRAQAATTGESYPSYGYTSTPSVSRPASPPPQSCHSGSRDRSRLALKTNSFLLPAESTMSRLINHFFREIGLVFPYINEESIMTELARLKANGLYGVRRSWLCLVNTIMAFSAYMSHNADQQGQIGREQNDNNNNDKSKDSDIYLARALSLLPNLVFQSANLEILQALLVLTQYMQGTEFSSSTWSFQRLSMQAAIQIGAHIPAPAKYSPLEQEIRNRCWHMCFILDRTCSMTFGRPPSILSDHAQVPLPQEYDFSAFTEENTAMDTSPSPSLNVTAYTQSIKLYRILGQIIDRIYQSNYSSAHGVSYDAVLSNVVVEETHLGKWKAQLPLPLYIISRDELAAHVAVPDLPFSLSLVLTLRYLNARTLLHRGIIESSFIQTQTASAAKWNGLDVYGKESIKITVESASDIIDMISTMTERQIPTFTTIWFLIYYVFNSSIVIFAVAALAASSSIPPFLTGEEVLFKLQTARRTLDKLGNQTRIVLRCRKYLTRLIEMASTVTTQQSLPLTGNAITSLHQFTTQAMESTLNLDSQILMPCDIDYFAFADNNLFFA